MLRWILLALLVSTPAAAQVHPCDEPLPNNPQLAAPVMVGLCHDLKDVNGNTTTLSEVRVFLDGQLSPFLTGTPTQVGTTPNGGGLFYFVTPSFSPTRGGHTVVVNVVGPG